MSVFYPEEFVIYALSFNDFMPFNVSADVLAKVRKNFFEHNKRQSDKLVQNINEVTIRYNYNMEKGKPMKWLVQRNKATIEQAISTSPDFYEICTYDEKGARILTTEFTAEHIINKVTFLLNGQNVVVTFDNVDGTTVLRYKVGNREEVLSLLIIDEDDEVIRRLTKRNPFITVTALTSSGVVYFGTDSEVDCIKGVVSEIKADIEEENKPKVYITEQDKDSGFNFNDSDFNIKKNMNKTFDIEKVDFFDGELNEEVQDNSVEEILSVPNDIPDDDTLEEPRIIETDEITDEEQTVIEEISEEENEEQPLTKAVVTSKDVKPIVTPEVAIENPEPEPASEPEPQENPANPDAIAPDLIINSGGERYLYFGQIDDKLTREGYGRTQMENGRTAYEGEYHKNKRYGYGSFYYRDGGLCYTGEWKNNKRSGFGMGIRSSDGSYHVGSWDDNKPNGFGARFDKYGNLSYVSNFKDGREVGLSVEYDNDGSISIFRWVNDEKKIIQKIYP